MWYYVHVHDIDIPIWNSYLCWYMDTEGAKTEKILFFFTCTILFAKNRESCMNTQLQVNRTPSPKSWNLTHVCPCCQLALVSRPSIRPRLDRWDRHGAIFPNWVPGMSLAAMSFFPPYWRSIRKMPNSPPFSRLFARVTESCTSNWPQSALLGPVSCGDCCVRTDELGQLCLHKIVACHGRQSELVVVGMYG